MEHKHWKWCVLARLPGRLRSCGFIPTKLLMVIATVTFLAAALVAGQAERVQDDLVKAFETPPNESRCWCYWWWLNGAASREGITRDFEEMRNKGIGGALPFDAGEGGTEAPRGPKFMSPEWRELYKHAVREADRCGIVLGVNLCSGWDAGGPWVTHEYAAKKLVGEQTLVRGPGRVSLTLPKPAALQGYYRDIAVLACPAGQGAILGYTLRASSHSQNYPRRWPKTATRSLAGFPWATTQA